MSGEQLTPAGRDSGGAVKKNKNESKEMLVVLWLLVSCCSFLSPIWSQAEVTAG